MTIKKKEIDFNCSRFIFVCRLEEEEQARQKLQIERIQLDSKIKNLEDTVATQQNDLTKV